MADCEVWLLDLEGVVRVEDCYLACHELGHAFPLDIVAFKFPLAIDRHIVNRFLLNHIIRHPDPIILLQFKPIIMIIKPKSQTPQQASHKLLTTSLPRKADRLAQFLPVNKLSLLCLGLVVHEETDCFVVLVVYCDLVGAHFVLVEDVDVYAPVLEDFL